jgi:2-succinyl-5-enolpyruvyl-6-hydroxy-3-cyclohexene-1-carboxylate synthase
VTGFPLLGDPLSGARFSEHCADHLVTTYDLFLQTPSEALRSTLKPDVVIRIGGAPVSAALLAFVGELADVPQLRITSGHSWRDHLAVASLDVRSDEAAFVRAVAKDLSDHREEGKEPSSEPSSPPVPSAWRERWREIDRTASQAVCDFQAPEGDALEGDVLAAVVSGVAEGTTLFVSNSMPVRDLDAFGGGGKPLRVYGNRGASGIDGILSTVAGIAAGMPKPSPVIAVVGDVAFYHDMNGLFAVAQHQLDIVFVVINNDGGGIFHRLPIRDHEPEFTRYFAVPHGLDFRHVADLYGISYRRVDHPGEAGDAFRDMLAGTGPRILEVRSDRDQNQRSREAVAQAVREAVTTLL